MFKLRSWVILIILISLTIPAFAQGYKTSNITPPTPRLVSPSGIVQLSPQEDSLHFKWTREGQSGYRQHYDFRIYKGRQTVADTLHYKSQPRYAKIDVPVDKFEEGQIYTWSVRQVYRSGKSRRNFETFEIRRLD